MEAAMDMDDGGAPRRAPGPIVAHRMASALCAISLVMFLAGGLGSEGSSAGPLAFVALLFLWLATAPPGDAWRGVRAAMILAGGVGLVALGSLARALWGGSVEVPDGAVLLVGAAVFVVDAARRCLGEGDAPEMDARRSKPRQYQVRQVPSRSAAGSPEVAHGRRAA